MAVSFDYDVRKICARVSRAPGWRTTSGVTTACRAGSAEAG